MMVSAPIPAPPVHNYFLVVFLDCNLLEIKDSNLTHECMCLIYCRIYGGLWLTLHTENGIRTMVNTFQHALFRSHPKC